MSKIVKVIGREIIDLVVTSTVEAEVHRRWFLWYGGGPSGAYWFPRSWNCAMATNPVSGKGVTKAVGAVNGPIALYYSLAKTLKNCALASTKSRTPDVLKTNLTSVQNAILALSWPTG